MSRARVAAQWFSILGPPVAVFLQQQLAYLLVQPACVRRATLLLQLPPSARLDDYALRGGDSGLAGMDRSPPPILD